MYLYKRLLSINAAWFSQPILMCTVCVAQHGSNIITYCCCVFYIAVIDTAHENVNLTLSNVTFCPPVHFPGDFLPQGHELTAASYLECITILWFPCIYRDSFTFIQTTNISFRSCANESLIHSQAVQSWKSSGFHSFLTSSEQKPSPVCDLLFDISLSFPFLAQLF